ncbi:bZIP transcription factor [Tenacibaculum sp. SDUM215027]|uniref:bZIP transcription factor n=1 Tax=Tenacibaculum sp. SDUM215027 TaxID=3422596 RepID=UPI003D30F083
MQISRKTISMIGLGLIILGTLITGYITISYRESSDKSRKRIEDLSEKNKELGVENSKLLQEVRNLNTGGDGFLDLRNSSVTLYQDGVQKNGYVLDLFMPIFNNGDYTFDNVKIKAFESKDFLNAEPVFLWTDLSSSGLNIKSRFPKSDVQKSKTYLKNLDFQADTVKPKQSILLGPIRFRQDFEYYGVNLFIESRRQDWLILVRFQRPKDKKQPFVNQIYRILKITSEGLEEIYQTELHSFPKFENGKTKWFKSEMPESWFKKK